MLKATRNPDGTYGPTDPCQPDNSKKYYKPKPDHNPTATKTPNKTRWKIEEGYQFHVFRIAAEPNYQCDTNNCLFSIVDDGQIEIGENGEVVAKFPTVQNMIDPWHGYPVLCRQVQNMPSTALLDKMIVDNFISESTRQRIEKKKL